MSDFAKELKVSMDFYMEMKDGETKEQAIERFHEEFRTEAMTTESSIQVYGYTVQECVFSTTGRTIL